MAKRPAKAAEQAGERVRLRKPKLVPLAEAERQAAVRLLAALMAECIAPARRSRHAQEAIGDTSSR